MTMFLVADSKAHETLHRHLHRLQQPVSIQGDQQTHPVADRQLPVGEFGVRSHHCSRRRLLQAVCRPPAAGQQRGGQQWGVDPPQREDQSTVERGARSDQALERVPRQDWRGKLPDRRHRRQGGSGDQEDAQAPQQPGHEISGGTPHWAVYLQRPESVVDAQRRDPQ